MHYICRVDKQKNTVNLIFNSVYQYLYGVWEIWTLDTGLKPVYMISNHAP